MATRGGAVKKDVLAAISRMNVLKCCYDTAETNVTLSSRFRSQPALFRADVLKDWIYILEREYDIAVADMRDEFEALRTDRQEGQS